MHMPSKKDASSISATLHNRRLALTASTLRTTLELPVHQTYDPLPSKTELMQGLEKLGYDAPLPFLSHFKLMNLPYPWKTLFGLVNKCLSPKHAGHDKCNMQIFQIFHGIVFNKTYDMAQLFWIELVTQVQDKEDGKTGMTIPYARWLALIIDEYMTAHLGIPKRRDEDQYTAPKLQYFKHFKHETVGMTIPDYLLDLGNPRHSAVVQYRESLQRDGPMVQQNPAGPAPGPKPRASKGPKRARKPQKPVARVPHEGKSDDSLERNQTAEGTRTNAAEPVNESFSPVHKKADDEASNSVAKDDDDANDDDDEDDIDDVEHTFALIQKGKLPLDSPPKKITPEDAAPFIAVRPKTIVIKQVKEPVTAKIAAPRSPKAKKQRPVRKSLVAEEDLHIFDDCLPFITISRAESLSTGANLVGSRVEAAASGSTARAPPSPSHSLASQKANVSTTRDSPTSLVPSEPVERSSGPPPEATTPSFHTSSLGVTFPTFSNFSRTTTPFTAHTGAHTLNTTTGVQTMMVGSPAMPTMTSSLNAGHTSALFTDAVTTITTPITGSLTPEDVTVLMNRYMESTIKPWVQQAFTSWAQDSKTTPAVHSEQSHPKPHSSPSQSIPQPTPVIPITSTKPLSPSPSQGTHDTELVSPSTSTNPFHLSRLELADLLFLRLLEVDACNLTPFERDLLQVFFNHDRPQYGTCRDSPRGLKRSHEDPDDSEPHEGENKRPRTLEQAASTSHEPQPNTSSNQPTNQPPPSSSHNQAQLSSLVELDETSRGLSPRDTVRGGDGSPVVVTSGTSQSSGHRSEHSSKSMTTSRGVSPKDTVRGGDGSPDDAISDSSVKSGHQP
ncbi:unnamed protein product [Cuscuta europaea]|uniref:Uncharacterized protein n=1 Tax=Cuscuta europaea TaxID=41803 RepID=A0A9P0YT47_CUSEU|nr:unnamed protein product [Cuscuta europaea]